MPFEERFDLLVESGQANAQSIVATRSALEMVEQHYGIQLTEELGASLATHLAITMKRLLDGETLVPVPDVVWQELNDYPEELRNATSIVARLEKELNLSISQDELGFIAVHLCKVKLQLRPNSRA
jgi:transcriptional antiterminator